MAMDISEQQHALLGRSRNGVLVTVGPDGSPHAGPVWYLWDGAEIRISTPRTTQKVRDIELDPRVAFCVDLERPPYAFVQVQGAAEISEDPADLVATATAIAARYMGPERAEEFGRRNGVPGELVVRVRPVKVLAGFDTIAPADHTR